ncbi:MAG: phosphoribosylglycinamide formyltransferase [Acutalibacteraceae bacterium]|nr:phosphoribosylglycinamide formyltransferase [Acutalibacteraceae bacterium]
MKNIVVLVSGGGTNLQALIDAQLAGKIPNGKITCVISSNPNAYALERAKNNNIDTEVIRRKDYTSQDEYDIALTNLLKNKEADLVVLAGFMTILGSGVIKAFENRIINIHPSLIPSFCGEGYYGLKVHERALERGVKVTGATAHFVNEVCDGGPIILQKAVEIQNGDTPEILQKRVMEQAEWNILPLAVSLFCDDKIKVINNKTTEISD